MVRTRMHNLLQKGKLRIQEIRDFTTMLRPHRNLDSNSYITSTVLPKLWHLTVSTVHCVAPTRGYHTPNREPTTSPLPWFLGSDPLLQANYRWCYHYARIPHPTSESYSGFIHTSPNPRSLGFSIFLSAVNYASLS